MSRTEQLRNAIPAAPEPSEMTPAAKALAHAKAKPDPARDLLASMEKEFAACLPKMLPPDLFMRVALTGFRKTPDLLECSRKSLLGALLETARLGLEPCTEQAYLIPYKNECTLVVGYQGFVQLMYRTGQVEQVEAEMIYEADVWEDARGDGGRFYHRPAWTPDLNRDGWTGEDRGKPIIAYSYARLVGGGRTKVEMCTRKRAEQIARDFAKSSKSPWKTGSFDAMWLKTPVRQLQKWAPKSAEMRRALAVDGATFDSSGEPDVDPNVIQGEFVERPTSGAPAGAGEVWPETAQPANANGVPA
ncbi:recombinase RecT [Micromonospora haikouensis]|uniref:recombinase RecT n=1 Tax=Micromonospora haikouensis TaxID=686309 RepID=UPI00341C0F7E